LKKDIRIEKSYNIPEGDAQAVAERVGFCLNNHRFVYENMEVRIPVSLQFIAAID